MILAATFASPFRLVSKCTFPHRALRGGGPHHDPGVAEAAAPCPPSSHIGGSAAGQFSLRLLENGSLLPNLSFVFWRLSMMSNYAPPAGSRARSILVQPEGQPESSTEVSSMTIFAFDPDRWSSKRTNNPRTPLKSSKVLLDNILRMVVPINRHGCYILIVFRSCLCYGESRV